MEGIGRGLAAWLAAALVGCALAAGGCGDDPSAVGDDAIQTANPERTFAPLLEVASDEPWRPVSARWFIDHSTFGISGCEDRRIAVGRSMPELRDAVTNWIFPLGLGHARPVYYRDILDERCESDKRDLDLYADQLTRPYDPGPRLESLPVDQGFYLDLVDADRAGPSIRTGKDLGVPVYAERTDEGDSGARITYWTLYGMHGRPGRPTAHEGDWERVDVLLNVDGDRYEPLAVQAIGDDGQPVDTDWSASKRVDGTHPVVVVAPATHAMSVARPTAGCAECVAWRAWDVLADAREQDWHGFGGAWGEVGTSSAATGPLGPHRHWLNAAQKERELAEHAKRVTGVDFDQ